MATPLRVALTGGIATGKSYCAAGFASLGIPVIDADQLARDVVRPGTAGLTAVLARFGAGVRAADGTLDRAALGRAVFADADARRDLEAIVHPLVYEAIRRWFEAVETNTPVPPFAIADIPLLFETGHAHEFDCVIVAACTPAQQFDRLMARGGLSEAEARQRIASQWRIEEKAQRADIVIDTSGTLASTDRQIADAAARLSERAARRP